MEATDTGDRSFGAPRVESVAQASVALLDSNVTLNPALASLSRSVAAESVVLLKNEGALPLAPQSTVAVFGRCQIDFFCVGYGSGGDVKAPYAWNLVDGMRDAGLAIDEELAEYYTQWTKNNPPEQGGWAQWPFSFTEAPLPKELVSRVASRVETAVVVIGRAAGEARDNELAPGSYYLTQAETDMLDAVCGAFSEVVVVADTGGIIDFSWADVYGDRISALVLAWQGGMEGARGVAGVLAGEVSPSGRLTSTIAAEYADYPGSSNFGNLEYNEYVEDIFVGYRYFETFAPGRVRYPFGYGLSYTSFKTETYSTELVDDVVRIHVKVTNTGPDVAGREVVQAYMQPPRGKLAKPKRTLIAFGKTGLLAPGDTETLELEAPLSHLASYDDTGASGYRSAWVLEAGTYQILVGSDVREATTVFTFDIPHTRVIEQLQEVLAPPAENVFSRMTVSTDAAGKTELSWEEVPPSTTSRRDRILGRIERDSRPDSSVGDASFADVVAGQISLSEFVGQLSVEELTVLTRGDLVMNSPHGAPGNAGVLGGTTPALTARGIPPITTTDGPSGIRLASYASLLPSGTSLASTWDPGLVTALNTLLGQEMIALGSDVLLSPGMNIQRNPLCGRNFEYYSEDPLLTGTMAAAAVQGIQSQGVAACPKHFAANNQEANRVLNDSRVSERALREIYLRGFRFCVENAHPWALMTSYNKINGVYSYYNDDLVTTVLRDEWGYDGVVITDWWTISAPDPDFANVRGSAYRVRAQVDVLMPGGQMLPTGPSDKSDDEAIFESVAADDGLRMSELRRSAENTLRLALRLAERRNKE